MDHRSYNHLYLRFLYFFGQSLSAATYYDIVQNGEASSSKMETEKTQTEDTEMKDAQEPSTSGSEITSQVGKPTGRCSQIMTHLFIRF